MLRFELKRLDPVRTANILGLVQGAIMLVFVLLFSPVLLIAILIGAGEDATALFGFIPLVVILVVYPLMGLILGWIGGLVAASVYNLVIRFTGGLIFEFRDLGMGVTPVAPPRAADGGIPPAADIGP